MTDHVSTHQAEDDARNEAILIYVDGKIVPKAMATVSVYDSGFMLGDGVWEGIRLYNGRWTFLDEHIDRLFEAAKAIDLQMHLTREQVISAVLDTQSANAMQTDAHARLMVTRGVKTRPFQNPRLSQQGPTMVIIMEHSRQKLPRPITLATVPHLRGLPMTQDPKLNSHSKLNCILACIAAQKADADEALMLDVHGFVNTTNACTGDHGLTERNRRRLSARADADHEMTRAPCLPTSDTQRSAPTALSAANAFRMASPACLATSSELASAKIDGPEPDKLHPSAPAASAAALTA